MQAKPDCCSAPALEIIERLWDPPGPERDLRQCRNCGAYWRFDYQERVNFSGGEDYAWECYTRLTPVDAAALIDPGKSNPEH